MGKLDRPDGLERNRADEGTAKPGEHRSDETFKRAVENEEKGILVEVLREWLRK